MLLKNRDDLLPMRRGRDVFVAGSNADNIGNQAGGWTLTWQGGSTNVIPGTTILQGIEAAAGGGDVTYSVDGSGPIPRNAVGVVVVGETPYAEGFGDVYGPRWAFDPGDNGVPRPVKNMQLSARGQGRGGPRVPRRRLRRGRRLRSAADHRRPATEQIDSLVAAWLPGSEGGGVADTLFGAEPYTGKLPVSWPRSLSQEPINIGDRGYDPLYRFGYGIQTEARGTP